MVIRARDRPGSYSRGPLIVPFPYAFPNTGHGTKLLSREKPSLPLYPLLMSESVRGQIAALANMSASKARRSAFAAYQKPLPFQPHTIVGV